MDAHLDQPGFVPLMSYREYPPEEMLSRSREFAAEMQRRRTVRQFSDRPVSRAVIEACIETAGTAPSGAHQQPWHFEVISDPGIKRAIRKAAETAEVEFYATAPSEWLAALAPLGTDDNKPYLETAPYLIAIFSERYGVRPDGSRQTHYYVMESVGIAAGFLNQVLERPSNERAVMLLVVGYPASDVKVPYLKRKPLSAIANFR